MDYIAEQQAAHPDLREKLSNLGELYTQRLWHQLTDALMEFVSNPANKRDDNFHSMYERFISKFEGRLSQVRFAQIISSIGHGLGDPAQGMEFFRHILRNRTRLGAEAALCVDMDIAILNIQMGELEEAKSALESGRTLLDGMADSGAVAFSRYYRAASEYHKLAGPPEKYYHDSLMLISYTPISELSEAERFALATDICLAALTGDGIYNFGEVISTPILAQLDGTDNAWLKQLIEVFDRGDIEGFNRVVAANHERYFAQPSLSTRNEFVKQKLVLMALMDMIFERPPQDRSLTFDAIAQRTRLPRDQVEFVLMRAMSQGVVRGSLDEVEGVARITWVQPRVLGKDQLTQLRDRLAGWHTKVRDALVFMEGQTPELYV